MTTPDTLVIGVGNPDRGDDGIGHAVARALAGQQRPGIRIKLQSGEALSLITAWEGFDDVVLIDAASSEAPAGTVHAFDATREIIPERRFNASSHGFGVTQALELARVLDRVPARCRVFAIEGADFDHGAGLSPALNRQLHTIVAEITAALTQENMVDA